ncbi:MAG: glucose 1-dehydrogenase, partial [Saprospiraceae bacterium]
IMKGMQHIDLSGKVAIVTGSSKGIGLSIATAYAEAGAKVIISSRKQEAVDEVAAHLQSKGYTAKGIACHVGDETQLQTLVDQTIAAFGRIDILVNNAATNPVFGPVEEASPVAFDKIVQINVKSPWQLSNLCLPYLKESGGSIIHISSVEGLHPGFGLGLYSMIKAALIMLGKNQAKEWGRYGVRVNVICPGLVQTQFSEALWTNEKLMGQLARQIPAGRMAQPEEMTGLALLLAIDAGSYMTGGVYTVDGGYMVGF